MDSAPTLQRTLLAPALATALLLAGANGEAHAQDRDTMRQGTAAQSQQNRTRSNDGADTTRKGDATRQDWTQAGDRDRKSGDMKHTADDGMRNREAADSTQPIDDTWITTKVKASLLADDDVAGLEVDVKTVNGIVHLRGEVESQRQTEQATAIARGIEGVRSVDASGLRTSAGTQAGDRGRKSGDMAHKGEAGHAQHDRSQTGERAHKSGDMTHRADDGMRTGDAADSTQPINDTWITTKVKSSLLASDGVAGLDVDVETINGVVHLRGEVENPRQTEQATAIARGIEGVRSVDASGLRPGADTDR